jgi:hypothetical protein
MQMRPDLQRQREFTQGSYPYGLTAPMRAAEKPYVPEPRGGRHRRASGAGAVSRRLRALRTATHR